MAHVSRAKDDGGQVIILAGFLVAIGIVVLAAFLNGLIFAQDLSTRDDGVKDRQIIGFEQDTERFSTAVASTVGVNGSGNGNVSQDDLFEPGDARDNFNDAVEQYDDNTTRQFESRQAVAQVSTTTVSDDTAWSIGQTNGEFQNDSGDTKFRVIEAGSERDMVSFEMYVEDPFGSLNLGDETLRISAYEDPLPPQAQADKEGTLWELSIENNNLLGDEMVNVSRNTTAGTTTYNQITNPDIQNADNLTVRITPQDGEACLIVDRTGVCEAASGDLEPGWLDSDIESVTVQDFSSGGQKEGSYEMRFEEDLDQGEIELCGAPCVSTSGDIKVHAVGIVHDTEVDVTYIDSDAEYENSIEVSAEQELFPLEAVDE